MSKLKDRYNILIAVFIIIGVLFSLRLANLQIINGSYYDQASKNGLATEEKIPALRGNILDRNGETIASNRVGSTVSMIRANITKAKLNAMLLNLDKLFADNGDSYFNSFDKVISYPIKWGTSYGLGDKPAVRFIKEFGVEKTKAAKIKTAKDAFKYLREHEYEVDGKYSGKQAYKIITLRYEMRNSTSLKSVRIASDISKKTVAKLEEMNLQFPGISTGEVPFRKYINAQNEAHVIGYVRGVSEEDLAKDNTYNMTDVIGKSGIELTMEKYLRGTDGLRRLQIDVTGRTTSEVIAQSAIPGNDIVLTLDAGLQKIATQALKNTIKGIHDRTLPGTDTRANMGDAFAGAVVAMDVNSGEILAMSSYPTYDPSVYLKSDNDKKAQNLIVKWNQDGTNLPLFNRAIQGRYPPGSSFKPVVSLAALESGTITRDSTIYDGGSYVVSNWPFHCLEYPTYGHGSLNLKRGLATSCNIFFEKLGVMTGIDQIDKWAKYFGLGELTGIDLLGEVKGSRSNPASKKVNNPQDGPWGGANTAMTSIGQYDNSFTPLELVTYATALATDGKRYVPHLVKRIVGYDGTIVSETKPKYTLIPASKDNFDAIREGMVAVTRTSEGTAESLFRDYPYTVAAKTGTAETFETNHSSNAVFMCYAPAEKPEIAILVVIQRGVWGNLAGNVAKDILDEYFKTDTVSKIDDKVTLDQVQLTR
ncbi:MAG: penicillin-binding transpeptidase domain-containing protein [Clostridia bacterium]|jgi:penicillin-binding protein 2